MMQFGTALYKDDCQSKEILEFIEIMKSGADLSTESIERIRKLTRQSASPGRSILVYARLFFWGFINYDEAIDDLTGSMDFESFNRLDAFERIEISSCLGPRLASKLTGIDITEARDYRDATCDDVNVDFAVDFESDEIWCYTPPPTGFFSVIENILIAKFICRLQRKTFRLDENFQNWWRYPVAFNAIFPNTFELHDSSTDRPVKYMQWKVAREIMKSAGHDVLKYFSKFKLDEYKKIKQKLAAWLNDQGDAVELSAQSAVYFIRGGDKLLLETVAPPDHVIENDFDQIFKFSDRFMVLSDDYQMAESFRHQYGASKIENITDRSCGGYYAMSTSSVEDVRRIVKNYLIIASVKYSMSCPSSNLVNSAHWSNQRLEMLHLSSTPILRYSYL